MRWKHGFFLICVCLPAIVLRAQLLFTELPVDMKLIPRGADNLGRFTVAGTSLQASKKFVRITLRNTTRQTTHVDKVLSLGTGGKFSIELSIPAAFEEYQLNVYSLDALGNEYLEEQVNRLVAGDYFIVGGQSNAAGSNGYDSLSMLYESTYKNTFCRSLGTLFEKAIAINWETAQPFLSAQQECVYHEPSAIYFENGCVATWPYRAMYEIAAHSAVPLCFVNAARGGTNIRYHLASHTPSDPTQLEKDGAEARPYDRTFYKLYHNKALEGVKGIIWYQGESDGDDSIEVAQRYTQQFQQLYQSWKTDYPNLQKVFVFQINTGCWGPYLALIREQQRRFPESFKDLVLMPAVGSSPGEKNSDGCHYNLQGNHKLAEIVYPLVLKHVYQLPLPEKNISAPMIRRVAYVSANRICLHFDQDIDAQQSEEYNLPVPGTVYLKDYFYHDGYLPLGVQQISISGNKLFLDLPDSLTKIKTITYLPNNNSDLPSVYLGPWIVNKWNTRLGAFSFYDFPVRRSVRGFDEDSLARPASYIHVYPSPADEQVQIELGDLHVEELRVIDLHGRECYRLKAQPTYTLPTAHLAAGLYTLLIYQAEGVWAHKFFIEHK